MKKNAILALYWQNLRLPIEAYLRRHPDDIAIVARTWINPSSIAADLQDRIVVLESIPGQDQIDLPLLESDIQRQAASVADTSNLKLSAEDRQQVRTMVAELARVSIGDLARLGASLDAAQRQYHIKLMCLNEDVLWYGRYAALWAKQHGIPSLHMSHSLALTRQWPEFYAEQYADVRAIFSERGAEEYADQGVGLDKFKIVGNPRWDELPALSKNRAAVRTKVAQRAGLDTSRPMVVFATTWPAYLTATVDTQVFSNTLRPFLSAIAALGPQAATIQWVIKDRAGSHDSPAGEVNALKAELGIPPSVSVIYDIGDALEWVVAADLVVAVNSNILIEAMIATTPAINLSTLGTARQGPCFGPNDGVADVDADGLPACIWTLLTDSAERERAQKLLAAAAPKYNIGVDGLAGARLVELMTSMAATRRQPAMQRYVWQEYLDVEEIEATGYHGGARGDLAEMFVNNPKLVLDIGCAAGGTGELIKKRFPNCKVWGIETNKSAADLAATRIDKVLVGKFEDFDLEKEGIRKGSLDGVILADVLEHMYNPWAVMTSLHAYLSTSAQVIISIPNVRNLKLMEDLAAGYWRYESAGLLDITHIRFFSLKEFRRFLHETGYHMSTLRYGIDQRLGPFFQANRDKEVQDIELGRMRLKGVTQEELSELCSLQFYISARMGALTEDIRTYHAEEPYAKYLARNRLTKADGFAYDRLIESWADRPRFAVAVFAPAGSDAPLARTIRNLTTQLYKEFVIWVVSPDAVPPELKLGDRIKWMTVDGPMSRGLNAIAQTSDAEWLAWLRAGDTLESQALLLFAEAAKREPERQFWYSDEDQWIQEGVSSNPRFKSDFDPHALLSTPYLGGLSAVRRAALLELGGIADTSVGAENIEMAFRSWLQWGEASVGHIPAMLFHTGERSLDDLKVLITSAQQLGGAVLNAIGLPGALAPGWLPGTFRVEWQGQVAGRVSLLVPVRDNLAKVQRFVEAVFEKTQHADIELLLLDTGSTEPGTVEFLTQLDAMGDPRVVVFQHAAPMPLPGYFNLLAREAKGDYLALMHFDSLPLEAAWLDTLLHELQRPGVGMVAPRLLDGQGKVRGGGLILGINGGYMPAFGGMAHDDAGPMGRAHYTQCFSAIAGGCWLVRREDFAALEGFNTDMGVTAEVDFCLRLAEAGRRTLWTPFVSLMNDGTALDITWDGNASESESVSLSADQNNPALEPFLGRWLSVLARDPAYNPGFCSQGLAFGPAVLSVMQHMPLPWKPLPRILIEPADLQGCGNYRMIQPGEALGRAQLAEALFTSDLLHACEYKRLNIDTLVAQRQIYPHQVNRLAQVRKFNDVFIVYELDDLITNLPEKSLHRGEMPEDVAQMLRTAVTLCDRFVVSTEPLAHAYRGYNSDIRVMPNCIDGNRWGQLEVARIEGRRPRVGWAGGVSHSGDLDLIADVVKTLADEVDWIFLGMCPESLRGYVKEFYPGVAIDKYPAKLASLGLDLAIAPLEINPFNEAKSNLKVLEYGILGYPVICTDIVPYQGDLPVQRVKNRAKDWVAAIREMVAEPDAMAAAGLALQAAVRKDWMLESHVDAWLKAWSRS
ncbi:MAG: methyltransferase domain-containing protein [Burkholderiales bacterium]|nr:methyltransferase domain-containing protein [Burkholderiales bacterium]